MNTTENNHTSDSWQDLLDEAFGPSESKPQNIPAAIPDQPEEPEQPVEEEPVILPKPRRKFYKKPVFWILGGAAILSIAAFLFFLPTLLTFSMWPQLKECKAALDQWQKLDCYRLESYTYSKMSSNSDMLILDDVLTITNSTEITRCGNDFVYLTSTLEHNQRTSSVLLCKDSKYYSQSYDASTGDPFDPYLRLCAPQPFPKSFPMDFSWFGKKIEVKETTYFNDSLETISISVSELFTDSQYDLVFRFKLDGTLNELEQFIPIVSSTVPLMTRYNIITTDESKVQHHINSYSNYLTESSTQ